MNKTSMYMGAILTAFFAASSAGPSAPESSFPLEDLAAANNAFTCDLFKQLRTSPGNIFFSPFSISTALAMTYAGARGETAQQMCNVLHLPGDQTTLPTVYAELLAELKVKEVDPPYQLHIANRLWGQTGFEFLTDFLQTTREFYGAELVELDFQRETEKSRLTINEWVAEQTAQKIQNLIPSGALDPNMRLVLTNAIYFHGKWAQQFPESGTRDEPFFLNVSDKTSVPMMHQKDSFAHASFPELELLAIPYQDDVLSMVILLPQKRDGLSNLEEMVDTENLKGWLAALRSHEVRVTLPKFKLTSQFRLARILSALGMSTAFTHKANFSGITTAGDIFIDDVIHKAFVDVHEEGTEAAAATGITMALTSAKPEKVVEFRADHPFVFMIRDNRTGSILFFGRVTNPRG